MSISNRCKVGVKRGEGEKFGSGERLFFESAHGSQLFPSPAQAWSICEFCTDVFIFKIVFYFIV